MYSDRKKNIANSASPSSSPATLAPRSVRSLKIENGISGLGARASQAMNRASRPSAMPPSPIVWNVPQPALLASTSAYTSRASPPVTSAAPWKSK